MKKLLFLLFISMSYIHAQEVTNLESKFLGKSEALRDLQTTVIKTDQIKTKWKTEFPNDIPNFHGQYGMPSTNKNALPIGKDPLYNPIKGVTTDIEPSLVIEGLDIADGANVTVPDVNGDVSHDHYIQTINGFAGTVMKVWNKSDGSEASGLIYLNNLWVPLGATGVGDPIILWDERANKWFITEFTQANQMLAAVSVTDDPLGEYYVYAFTATSFPDYPKFSVWGDSYLVTTNEGGKPYIPVYAMEREVIISGGDNPGFIEISGLNKFNAGYDVFEVASPAHPSGLSDVTGPGIAVRMYDDSWFGGEDRLEIWEVIVDWENTSNSRVEGPIQIPTAAFKSEVCAVNLFACLPQSNGTLISALQQVIMNRVQYREFENHQSLVLSHTVDVDNNQNNPRGGVRWYELRKENETDWYMYQQGTIADSENHRFMSTINIDRNGNILVGYATMGPEIDLSLRYTGRLNGDPLGEMTITEYDLKKGTGTYEGIGRWGDYFSMSVDPSNDSDFWLTGQWMTAQQQWGDAIAKIGIQRDTNDLAATAILTPMNSGYLGDTENVTIEVRNIGIVDQVDFSIGYFFEGNGPFTAFIEDTLKVDSTLTYTFPETVNMDVIGDYEFKAFVALAIDQNISNDTLEQTISKLTRNDAQIVRLTDLEQIICDSFLTTEILLNNPSDDTLFNVDIYVSINSGPEELIEWEGELLPNSSEFIEYSSNSVQDGVNSIDVRCELPNGIPDEDPSNDSTTDDFTIVEEGTEITLRLTLDFYPQETSWRLEDDNNTILYESEMYLGNQQFQLIEFPMCVPRGECYTFRLFDSYGDGLGYGGDYEIVAEDGETLAELINQNFGYEEENEFCLEDEPCNLEAVAQVEDASGQNTPDGSIIVTVMNATPPIEYSLDNVNWQGSSIFPDLLPGDYTVYIRDANDCTFTIEVTVNFSVGVSPIDNSISVNFNPNPVTQVFYATADGLDQAREVMVRIIDEHGRFVRHRKLARANSQFVGHVSMVGLLPGSYFVQLMADKGVYYTQTMVKI